jgi:diaminohydroxyphosphoribosylaminopyrimidine deaminase/5-amino-6-(5-phosphoribosylamino)uracil reductase
MAVNETYMHRCLQLAKLGAGHVAPNPMVGAVLVYQDKIIGEGYHKKFGEFHAEVNCINSVADIDKHLIEKSTLYVSLEPCSHYGKTPPCSDLIIKSKIPEVVIGCVDVYKEVDGKGIAILQNAGVNVTIGILESECIELNKRFFTFHEKKRPYIILKWAQSANGKIGAKNKRILISNDYTNRLVHKWRSEEASILIGTNTALADDPSLTTRSWKGNDPIRLVIDMDLSLPSTLKLFDKQIKTIIFNKINNEEEENLIFYKIDPANNLQSLSDALYKIGIQSVLVEGGAKLLQSFIDEGSWDEASVIMNKELIIENGVDAPELSNFIFVHQEKYFTDTISFFQHSS